MDRILLFAFFRPDGAAKAQLKGNVRQYVKNDGFCNLVENVDINDMDTKNMSNPGNAFRLAMQARAFTAVPGLVDQGKAWIRSVVPDQKFPAGL